MKYIGIYIVAFLTMVLIDMVWLRIIAVSWYQEGMGSLLAESPNLIAATAFYVIFPIGLMIFAILPAQGQDGILKVLGMGALFGFFAYATYDLTNLAVIKNWPLGLTILDMAWGSLVSGVTAAAGKFAMDYLHL